MQLRTVKKSKNKLFDLGRESQIEQISARKTSMNKDQEVSVDNAENASVKIV